MRYILKNKQKINRPIVFLCGPYYQKSNKADRRNIMRKCFEEAYGDNVLPLIIDDFLTEDNIRDSKVNIQLLEEIFAAISYKTYIFLDTLSAASELGLFMNHAFSNKVVAYIPKESDIINKKNVGYFVKDVILKMNSEQAQYMEYRPSIIRSVICTDYATEHYGFIDNVIPENIKEDILGDVEYAEKKEVDILLQESEGYPDKYNCIYYQKQGGKTYVHIGVRLLFYVVISLMYEKYSEKLVTNKSANILNFDVSYIERLAKESFVNFLVDNGVFADEQIVISTILNFSFEDIVYHIVTFCYVYHCFSTYKGIRLVEKHMDTVLDNYKEISDRSPLDVFGLDEQDYIMLCRCVEEPERFYASFSIVNGKKKRELVKYKDTEDGRYLRSIHKKMISSLNKSYNYCENSYAYKKGSSIKKCVEKHKDSNAFIKYDISKFFNSINRKNLFETIRRTFDIDSAYDQITQNIISSFYYKNMLPLGLVISPLLSDIYMQEFDNKIIKYCEEHSYIYTRYADDIMISKKGDFSDEESQENDKIIDALLEEKRLKVNHKKKKRLFLEKDGQHIKYIGVNIVYFAHGNRISVGKQYIYDVAKEYHKYRTIANMNSHNLTPEIKEKLFYEERRIAGKISFIRQIEGDEGWEKVKVRLRNNTSYFKDEKLRFIDIS